MTHPSSISLPVDPLLFQQLRAILEALPVGIWLTDRQGNILLDNPAAARIWGRRFVAGDHLAQCQGWWADTGEPLGPGDWSLGRVLASGEPILGEVLEIAAFDGGRKTILSSSIPLRDASGSVEGALVINEDITALNAAQVALREREQDYRAFFDLAGIGAGEVDVATGRYLRVNRRFCEFTGYTEAELSGLTVVDLAPPAGRDMARAVLARVQAGERHPWSGELGYRRKDGTIVPGWVNLTYVARGDGSVRAIATVQDLAPQKAAEAALRQSEAEYRALFELAGVAKTEADLTTGRYLRVNRKYCDFTGYTEEELLQLSLGDLIYPEDRAENDARIARVLAGERDSITFERRYRRQDGMTAWGLVSLAFIDGPDGHLRSLATIQDIGERKRAEQSLQLQDERMRLALRAASVIMFTQDRDLRYTWVYNPLVASSIVSQTIGKTDAEMLPPDQAARLVPIKRRVLAEGVTLSEELSAPLQRDGGERTYHFRSIYQPLRDATGAITGLIGLGIDITERKEAEAAQRRSEERLRVALANSPVTVYAQDRDLRYTFLHNPTSGSPLDTVLGRADAELIANPDEAARLTALKRQVLDTGEPLRAEVQVTFESGRQYFDLSIEPLRDAAGAVVGVTGAGFDITGRKWREQHDQLLAQAGDALGASLDLDDALQAITDLLVPGFADWCVVSTVEAGWVVRRAARHVSPAGETFLRSLVPRYPLGDDGAPRVSQVIVTGRPIFLADGSLADATPPDDPDLRQRIALGVPGAVSQIVVPLTARGRVLGAINACLGPGARRFDRDDLTLMEELGRRAALALDNARLYAAERAAREAAERATARALRLQEATAALSSALTPDDVARVAVASCMVAVGAVGGAITLLGADGQTLEMRHAVGYPDDVVADRRVIPLDHPTPRAVVARTGAAIWIDSPEEGLRHHPDDVLPAVIAHGQHSWANVPLVVGGRILGSLLLSFDRPHALDEGDRASIQALAGLCAQAIERARLYEAEQSLRSRLQQILAVLPQAVLGVDAAGHFALANSAAIATLGFDPVGQPLPVAGSEAYRVFGARRPDGTPYLDQDLPLERAVLRGETTQGEQLILRNAATGTDVSVLVSAAPLRDARGASAGGIAAFQDITALKTLERLRDDFYAAVSHDLKNPLTIIRAHTQLVQRQLGKLDPAIAAPLADRLGTVVAATDRMNQLLGDLLDHARLQTGEPLELALQPTDLVPLLHRMAAQWGRLSDQHRFVVSSEVESLTLPVDPRRFERVLENLLSNAVKYSPAGGPIALAAGIEEREGQAWAAVVVRDGGIGIPAGDLPHIFDSYRRGGNVRGQIVGSGLGLANARRLIEQHGGTIAISSVEGEGTTVTIRLPWRPRSAGADFVAVGP